MPGLRSATRVLRSRPQRRAEPNWSIFRRSGLRFAAENATTEREIKRSPILSNRDSLQPRDPARIRSPPFVSIRRCGFVRGRLIPRGRPQSFSESKNPSALCARVFDFRRVRRARRACSPPPASAVRSAPPIASPPPTPRVCRLDGRRQGKARYPDRREKLRPYIPDGVGEEHGRHGQAAHQQRSRPRDNCSSHARSLSFPCVRG